MAELNMVMGTLATSRQDATTTFEKQKNESDRKVTQTLRSAQNIPLDYNYKNLQQDQIAEESSEQQTSSMVRSGLLDTVGADLINKFSKFSQSIVSSLKMMTAIEKQDTTKKLAVIDGVTEGLQRISEKPREIDLGDKNEPEEKGFMTTLKEKIVSTVGIAGDVLFGSKSFLTAGIGRMIASPVGAGIAAGVGIAGVAAGVGMVAGSNAPGDGAWGSGSEFGAGNPKSDRGLRNNNPGNIDWSPMWGKEGAKREILPNGKEGRFARFDTPIEGLRAMAVQLKRYHNAGRTTIRKIIHPWAPSGDGNNTEAYIQNVSRRTGFKADETFIASQENLKKLMDAMIKQENKKGNPYPESMMNDASSFGARHTGRFGGKWGTGGHISDGKSEGQQKIKETPPTPDYNNGYTSTNISPQSGGGTRGDGRYHIDREWMKKTSFSRTPMDDEILKNISLVNNSEGNKTIYGLQPPIKSKLLELAKFYLNATGTKLPVTSGWRSHETQMKLYKRFGPSRAAKPGTSPHESGEAIDAGRKPLDDIGDRLLNYFGFIRPIKTDAERQHMEQINHRLSAITNGGWNKPGSQKLISYAKKININIF